MPTNRNHLQCDVCGTKTITRVSLVYGPYREFAFPCAGCGVEIRFGVDVTVPTEEEVKAWSEQTKLPEEGFAPDPVYSNLANAKWIDTDLGKVQWMEQDKKIENLEILDDTFLIPVPKVRDLSPFILGFHLMGKSVREFLNADHIRRKAAAESWPELEQLILHHDRKQWTLFDRQFGRLFGVKPPDAISDKSRALFRCLENYGLVFCKDDSLHQVIKDRLNQAETLSLRQTRYLVDHYQSTARDIAIEHQLNDIRRRWSKIFSALGALYITDYWDPSKHEINRFTLAQKRFDELKGLYVDSFETLCRISVIAAGVEGIISSGKAVIPKAKGEFTLEEFEVFKNGSKPDVLRRLGPPVSDLFVRFIDHKLRNGIGHNSAKYHVASDEVHYVIQNEKGRSEYAVSYISFCHSMFELYRQIETVSVYVSWLRLFYKSKGHDDFLFSAK